MSKSATPSTEPPTLQPSQPSDTDSGLQNTQRRVLEEKELETRTTKAALELTKLRLEMDNIVLQRQSLEHQLSWKTTVLEWVKAGTVFAALTGILATLYIGQRQVNIARSVSERQSSDAEESRAVDRFDKSISRLANQANVGARMSGVAGLRLFLTDKRGRHQREALHYLVSSIGQEKSEEVQQAILDAFADAKQFTQDTKDEVLRTAIELNRSLTTLIVERINNEDRNTLRVLAGKYLNKNPKELPEFIFIDSLNTKGLTFEQRMELHSVDYHPLFSDLRFESQIQILDNYVTIINHLLSGGAKLSSNDWRRLYCERCDFTPLEDMRGARFDGSFLSGAKFSRLKLRGASFQSADLGGTDFFASDLTDANLSWGDWFGMTGPNGALARVSWSVPLLECATLNGAKLDNLPLVDLTQDFRQGTSSITAVIPTMTSVNLDNFTNLDTLGIRIKYKFDGQYYYNLTLEQKASLTSAFEKEFLFSYPDPLVRFEVRSATRGKKITFDDENKVNTLQSDQYTSILNLSDVHDSVKPLFSSMFKLPFWEAMRATNRILEKSQTPNFSTGLTKSTESNKIDCSAPEPDAFQLLLFTRKAAD